MKPNWKKFAKEAYERGYEEGVKHSLKWTPATSPPKRTGEYICIQADLRNGVEHPAARISKQTYNVKFDGTGEWDNRYDIDYKIITHWCEVPPLPKFNIQVQMNPDEGSV